MTSTAVDALAKEVRDLETDLLDTTAMNTLTSDAISGLRLGLSDCAKKAQRFRELIELQQSSNVNLMTQIATLKRTYESETSRHDRLRLQLEEENRTIASNLTTAATSVEDSKRSISELDATLSDLRSHLSDLKTRRSHIASLEADLADDPRGGGGSGGASPSSSAAAAPVVALDSAKILKNRELIETILSENTRLEERISFWEEEMGTLGVGKLEERCGEEKKIGIGLNSESDRLRAELRNSLEESVVEITKAEYSQERLRELLNSFGIPSESDVGSLAELELMSVELESEIAPLEDSIRSETETAEDLGVLVEAETKEVESLRMQINQLETADRGGGGEVSDTDERLTPLKKLEQAKRTSDELKREEASLRADLERLEIVDPADEAFARAKKELIDLKKKVVDVRDRLSDTKQRLADFAVQKQFFTAALGEETRRNTRLVMTLTSFRELDRKAEGVWSDEKKQLQTAPPYIAAMTLLDTCLRDPRTGGEISRLKIAVNTAMIKAYLKTATVCERAKDWEGAVRALESASFIDPENVKVLRRRFAALERLGCRYEANCGDDHTGFGQLWRETVPRKGLFGKKKSVPTERVLLYTGGLYRGLKHGFGREFANRSVSFYGQFRHGLRHGQGVEYAKGNQISLIGEWYHGRLVKNLSSEEPKLSDLSSIRAVLEQLLQSDETDTLEGVQLVQRASVEVPWSLSVFRVEIDSEALMFRFFGNPRHKRDDGVFQAKLLKRLRTVAFSSHPNIARVHSLVVQGLPGILTEPLEQPFYPLLVDARFSEWRKKVELLGQVAEAMAYLHSIGVVHGAFSWQSVFLISDSPLVIKIGDYGLRRVLKHFTTLKKTMHTAPEVWQGKVEPQSDVFSFGIMMYELLKSTHDPFDCRSRPDDPRLTPETLPTSIRGGLRPSLLTCQLPTKKKWWTQTMQRCWETQYDLRPSFAEVVEIVRMKTVAYCSI